MASRLSFMNEQTALRTLIEARNTESEYLCLLAIIYYLQAILEEVRNVKRN